MLDAAHGARDCPVSAIERVHTVGVEVHEAAIGIARRLGR